MIRVYIAGPYTKGDRSVNVREAMHTAIDLMEHGYAPYCPHLSHFLDLMHSFPYAEWSALDNEWLKVSDCVLRLAGESDGADAEVALAKTLGIPVFASVAEIWAHFFRYGRRRTAPPSGGLMPISVPPDWQTAAQGDVFGGEK